MINLRAWMSLFLNKSCDKFNAKFHVFLLLLPCLQDDLLLILCYCVSFSWFHRRCFGAAHTHIAYRGCLTKVTGCATCLVACRPSWGGVVIDVWRTGDFIPDGNGFQRLAERFVPRCDGGLIVKDGHSSLLLGPLPFFSSSHLTFRSEILYTL